MPLGVGDRGFIHSPLSPLTKRQESLKMEKTEKKYFELRFDSSSRTIEGTAIRYGEVSTGLRFKERFESGSINFKEVILNVAHDRGRPLARFPDGGLTLHNSDKELRIEAILPNTTEANDTLELIEKKVIKGLSIEFIPTKERMDGVVRVIDRAALFGIAIVDQGAYESSQVKKRHKDTQSTDNDIWRVL